jgi:hypothetical protein
VGALRHPLPKLKPWTSTAARSRRLIREIRVIRG